MAEELLINVSDFETRVALVRDGAVAVRPMSPLSLSYDHRVIDGAMGQRFMARLVESLQTTE